MLKNNNQAHSRRRRRFLIYQLGYLFQHRHLPPSHHASVLIIYSDVSIKLPFDMNSYTGTFILPTTYIRFQCRSDICH